MDDKDLYAGLIRLHVLHHAVSEGSVYGLALIEELGRHGYRLSAGTLYPILHGLERKGYLRSSEQQTAGRVRRIYRATPKGTAALAAAKERVWELFGEMFEPAGSGRARPHRHHQHHHDEPEHPARERVEAEVTSRSPARKETPVNTTMPTSRSTATASSASKSSSSRRRR